MAILQVIAGSYDVMYIGDYSASTTPLTRIQSLGTKGYKLTYKMAEDEFCFAVGYYIQSDNAKLLLSVEDLSDDPIFFNATMGNSITNSSLTAGSSNNLYSIFLKDSNTSHNSVWIPKIQANVETNIVRDKTTPLTLPVTFKWEFNDTTTPMYYYKPYTSLSSLMGSQYPTT